MLTTDQKGAIAEAEIAAAAIRLGIGVFKPLSDGERYDLIFDLRPKLVRVQCKTVVLRGSVLRVPCYSARRCANGFVKLYYGASEVDAIAAYNTDLDRASSSRSPRFREDRLFNSGSSRAETISALASTGQRSSRSPLN